ncbi:MAG: phosphatase PAP2 family protein [Longimicrobiales bacterium]
MNLQDGITSAEHAPLIRAVSARTLAHVTVALAAIVLAHLLDGWTYRNVRVENIYSEDWGRMLRVMGFLPLWFMAAIALWLHERPATWRRPLMLALSPALAGLAAELLKLLLRRERPNAHDGLYYFRPFTERTFSTGGLALPSSHAVVAFGAAAILSRLFPRARTIWWALAWGCGLTRVAAGAHFVSDVVVAAIVGWLVGAGVWKWLSRSKAATQEATCP